MTHVLFVCIGNQGRSVMAERLFREVADGWHEARSAGAAPGAETHPEVLDWADVVVAACDGACPVTPGKARHDWRLPDPMGRPLDEVRAIRDDVKLRVGVLLGELDR